MQVIYHSGGPHGLVCAGVLWIAPVELVSVGRNVQFSHSGSQCLQVVDARLLGPSSRLHGRRVCQSVPTSQEHQKTGTKTVS